MITNNETAAALDALLEEAGARICVSCGQRAAVRTDVALSPKERALRDAHRQADDVKWYCFECGHVE